MDDCHLIRSPSISSFDTNHSSWSFVGEDDFDLLDQDENNSASENDVNEMEEEDEQVEEEDEEESEDDTDDDISVVTEEDMLSDPSALTYTDVVKVSKQLDELSKCFDSPLTHILENFVLERNVRFMAIISAATIAIVMFCYAFGVGKQESLSFMSTDNVCFVNEDHFLGLQYRDAAPSSLHSFFETPLKPSLPAWSILPSSIPKLHAIEPFSWIFNSESIRASQDERRYSATNQCERVLIEHQFNGESETVRRYLRHAEKLKKPCRYESPILPTINETLVDGKSKESTQDGKLQMDLQVLIIDSLENWNSIKTELTKHPEANKIEISKSQKPSSIPKVIPPIPPFSANHLSIEPKIELLTSVRSPELPIQKEITSVSETITDLEHVEKKCVEAMPDIKNRKEKLEKKKKKPRYDADLSSIFTDPKLRGSEKLLGSDSEKELRQPKKGKSKILVISSVKKAISKTIERAKMHRDKLLEQFSKAVDNIAPKNRPKAFRMGEKTNVGKGRCVLNSTCNVLASLARTLAGITLFPAIVGQTNAAKYINSLLDLSTCTGLRLVCEKCWWTRECCPKERCTFLPWQRHFNTKRFLTSHGHKMFDLFEELGWSMPGKKRKGGDGKLKFKFDHLSRSTGSEKEMRSRQNKKKSMERYSRKNGVQGRIHGI